MSARSITCASVLCFALLVVAHCNATAQQSRSPINSDAATIETLAVVNGQEITRQHLAHECLRRFGTDVLQSMVNKLLVVKECQRLGIRITEKDVNDEIVRRAEKFNMSAKALVNLICTQRNFTVYQYKNDFIWKQMALRELAAKEIQVTRQEIDERFAYEYGPKVQVRQIAVNSGEKAEELLALARQDPDRFEQLAEQHSLDLSSAAVGGLLPPIRRFSGLPEYEQIAFSLQPGQISNVFQIQDKFLLIKCERVFPADQVAPNQVPIVQQRIAEEISNQKLLDATTTIYQRLQNQAQLQNVMNDPELSKKLPGVAAVVNDLQILKRDVAEECITRFGKEILESEIGRVLLLQSLEQNNVQVTEQDITAEIHRGAESRGFVSKDGTVDEQGWLDYVTRGDDSRVEFYIEDILWPSVALRKLVEKEVSVSTEDMQKGFEANFGPRVSCLAIVNNDQRTAFKVWKMATDNPSEEFFGQLANQYSLEQGSKNLFGQVPPIQMHSGSPALEKEAFRLKPGEISKVVQVGENWIILYCKGRTTQVVTNPDDVKDELHKNIFERKLRLAMEVELNRLRTTAQVDNFLAGTSQSGRNLERVSQRPAQQPPSAPGGGN